MTMRARLSALAISIVTTTGASTLTAGCAAGAQDARYPSREAGCPVKSFPAEPNVPVDELGVITVDCVGGRPCARQVLDAVCARGGDVAWGLGENALSSSRVVAHAAHTKRAASARGERGCPVQVFADAPSMPTENVGPVTALCGRDDSREVCLRELQDQACLLGGDVVWQVEGPTPIADKQRMRGRAAHSK